MVLRCCHASMHLENVGKFEECFSVPEASMKSSTGGHVRPMPYQSHPSCNLLLRGCWPFLGFANGSSPQPRTHGSQHVSTEGCAWLTEGSVRALKESNHCGHRRVPGPGKTACIGSVHTRGMQSCLEKALIGFQVMGLVVASPNTLVTFLVGIRWEVLPKMQPRL